MCHVKWYEVWGYRLQSLNGGGGDRPRPFIIIAIWAGFVLTENRGNTITRAHVSSSIGIMHLYIPELLGHDEWGGLLSPQERHSLRPENGAE